MAALRQVVDRLTLYLPVFLMGVLAMATYWLVRSAPVAPPPKAPAAKSHLPDYFMRDFAVRSFDAKGKLKSEVSGGEARHFSDTGLVEIDEARIRAFDLQGSLTIATARRAITNEDATEVKLIGSAQVVRAAVVDAKGQTRPALRFAGETLHAFMNTERVLSDQPVLLTRGLDHFTADSMDFDNRQRLLLLKGRVKGTLVPAPAVKPSKKP